MYRVNDEEIFLAPETIIWNTVLAAFDDDYDETSEEGDSPPEIDTGPLGIDDIDVTRERSGR